jgi:acyl-CoA-binding protein
MLDFTGKYKHAAWLKLKGMTKDVAQKKYIELVTSLQASQ